MVSSVVTGSASGTWAGTLRRAPAPGINVARGVSEPEGARGLYHRSAALATAEDTGRTSRLSTTSAAVLAELRAFGAPPRVPGSAPGTVPRGGARHLVRTPRYGNAGSQLPVRPAESSGCFVEASGRGVRHLVGSRAAACFRGDSGRRPPAHRAHATGQLRRAARTVLRRCIWRCQTPRYAPQALGIRPKTEPLRPQSPDGRPRKSSSSPSGRPTSAGSAGPRSCSRPRPGGPGR